ncbi:MAG: hypothetical protein WBX12_02330 [Candidatus Acidiferrales bacterium]
MPSNIGPKLFVAACVGLLTLVPKCATGQDAPKSETPAAADIATPGAASQNLADLLRQLQTQVQELSQQLMSVQAEQERSRAETADLRSQLRAAQTQLAALGHAPAAAPQPAAVAGYSAEASSNPPPETSAIAPPPSAPASPATSLDDRLARIEENQQLEDAKLRDQSQTRVESGAKYRLRLSGIVLFNLYSDRGSVDNQDFPQIAVPQPPLGSDASFGGSLRQSQIALDAFGPDILGAHTSANIKFDFAGGFPEAPNGVATGLVRLRTGVIRLDWPNTSIIAGQDYLFISPLSPTSLATLATPGFSYSGNLWAWAPQVRIERHFRFSDTSQILLQGGILDSWTGEEPQFQYQRTPTWGESSGQPAYAARVSYSRAAFGQTMTFGAGGYYARQDWGFDRKVDGWAGTLDLSLPLGSRVEFTGQFYRGRAIGGLGGGIGQTVIWEGSFIDPATEIVGLDSIGGWAQLKLKLSPKFQFNGGLGLDNPFASELREYGGNTGYYGELFNRNLTPMVNFIYRPRSDIVYSIEYRRLRTSVLDGNPNTANHINLSVGYLF